MLLVLIPKLAPGVNNILPMACKLTRHLEKLSQPHYITITTNLRSIRSLMHVRFAYKNMILMKMLVKLALNSCQNMIRKLLYRMSVKFVNGLPALKGLQIRKYLLIVSILY